MKRMELRLPAAVYTAMFESIPRFHRLALIGETREHFVLEHSRELLLVVVASDKDVVTFQDLAE